MEDVEYAWLLKLSEKNTNKSTNPRGRIMKHSDMYLLLAAIYAAPHIGVVGGIVMSVVCVVIYFYEANKEDKNVS